MFFIEAGEDAFDPVLLENVLRDRQRHFEGLAGIAHVDFDADLDLVGGTGSIAETDRCQVLVIGVGNILMGDEGVGIHVLRTLETEALPPKVQLLDGGTGGINLLESIARAPAVVMIDASDALFYGFPVDAAFRIGQRYLKYELMTVIDYLIRDRELAPLLAARYRLARQGMPLAGIEHLDLLFPTRRRYRGVWENCRLATIERNALGIVREDDLPGAEAPAAWLEYLRGGSADKLRRVAAHNHQDVVSLSRLVSVLALTSCTSAD